MAECEKVIKTILGSVEGVSFDEAARQMQDSSVKLKGALQHFAIYLFSSTG